MSNEYKSEKCLWCGHDLVTLFDPQEYNSHFRCRSPECIQKRKEHMSAQFLPIMDQLEFNYGLQ